MTQEEKQLLLKDLYARLPYKVKFGIGSCKLGIYDLIQINTNKGKVQYGCGLYVDLEQIKPYLRSMSGMTEEEDKEWQYYKNAIAESCDERLEERISELHDWFAAHHFDFRGLIKKGLALEAPKDMYNIN